MRHERPGPFLIFCFTVLCMGLVSCASRGPDKRAILDLLCSKGIHSKQPCVSVLNGRLCRNSSLHIRQAEYKGGAYILRVKVEAPYFSKKDLEEAMDRALRDALRGKGGNGTLEERTCMLLAKRIETLPFAGRRDYCLLITVQRASRGWRLLSVRKQSLEVCKTSGTSSLYRIPRKVRNRQ